VHTKYNQKGLFKKKDARGDGGVKGKPEVAVMPGRVACPPGSMAASELGTHRRNSPHVPRVPAQPTPRLDPMKGTSDLTSRIKRDQVHL
jgi:hypothetical protein